MEFANHWSGKIDPQRLRLATGSDTPAIQNLLQTAAYRHLHVDWYLPGDWLGSDGFVVCMPAVGEEKRSVRSRLFGERPSLTACLAVAADPLPAAWVRVAAIRSEEPALPVLAGMMETAVSFLRRQHAGELAWLAIYDWVNPLLPPLGFHRTHALETYARDPGPLPAVPDIPNLTIRPVNDSEFAALEAIEAAAFAPLWRQSGRALSMALPQTLSFDVVYFQERLIGYQMSTMTDSGAHLVRMTLHPDYQQRGIGSVLLAHILRSYQQRGLRRASLNTQTDNIPSQKLYEKFGFYPTGQVLPIWVRSPA